MPAPRGSAAATWSAVVADAVALEERGWAAQALALGWADLDLFGAVTDPAADSYADGLAVKLDGRRVLAVCEPFAVLANPGGGRTWFYRRDEPGAGVLWGVGNGPR